MEGRLFKPLAFTKNFSMAIAAILAITLDPAIRLLFTHMDPYKFRPKFLCRIVNALLVGKIHSEETHPISRPLMKIYHPVCEFVLKFRWVTVICSPYRGLAPFRSLKSLVPNSCLPSSKGILLYMPMTLAGISVTEAQKLLQVQDKVLRRFPEVHHVFGKAGRAETATDPAPFAMMETVILLKPESEWPKVRKWYSSWAPEWLQKILRQVLA